MGGKRIRERMRLKKYLILKLEEMEDKLRHEPTNDYFRGWVDCFKYTFNIE